MTDIHPTHACFDDAMDLFVTMLKAGGLNAKRDLRLVHAACQEGDKKWAHAWVQDVNVGVSYFVGLISEWPQVLVTASDNYARAMHVVEEHKYDYDEMIHMNRQHGNYGPWVERIRALCKDSKETYGSSSIVMGLPPGMEVCDFCSNPKPIRTYACRDIVMLDERVPRFDSSGEWMACADCAKFIDADDLKGLIEYAVQCWRAERPDDLDSIRTTVTTTHTKFWESRIYTEEDAS